jgi:ornithine cyclodeaminase/alanine dehydrogenase-like protein (mu-crystallin family)
VTTSDDVSAQMVIGAEHTRDGLPFAALIAALRVAFGGDEAVPVRHHHRIDLPDGEFGTLLLMPAWSAQSGFLGVKIATIYPGNSSRQLPGVYATYLLADAKTGRPLALLDGDQITARRTAAVAALAADYLARPDAANLLVVGSGRVAALLPAAFSAVRPIRAVEIWDRTPAKAEALAGRLRAEGLPARATASLQEAAARADIISCATLATSPLIEGSWLSAGTHLDLIGGFTLAMREADDACMARGRIYVDTPEAITEAGDLALPIRAGVIGEDAVLGTLADLCGGKAAGRSNAEEVTIFKAVGTALSDITAAALVYENACGARVS